MPKLTEEQAIRAYDYLNTASLVVDKHNDGKDWVTITSETTKELATDWLLYEGLVFVARGFALPVAAFLQIFFHGNSGDGSLPEQVPQEFRGSVRPLTIEGRLVVPSLFSYSYSRAPTIDQRLIVTYTARAKEHEIAGRHGYAEIDYKSAFEIHYHAGRYEAAVRLMLDAARARINHAAQGGNCDRYEALNYLGSAIVLLTGHCANSPSQSSLLIEAYTNRAREYEATGRHGYAEIDYKSAFEIHYHAGRYEAAVRLMLDAARARINHAAQGGNCDRYEALNYLGSAIILLTGHCANSPSQSSLLTEAYTARAKELEARQQGYAKKDSSSAAIVHKPEASHHGYATGQRKADRTAPLTSTNKIACFRSQRFTTKEPTPDLYCFDRNKNYKFFKSATALKAKHPNSSISYIESDEDYLRVFGSGGSLVTSDSGGSVSTSSGGSVSTGGDSGRGWSSSDRSGYDSYSFRGDRG